MSIKNDANYLSASATFQAGILQSKAYRNLKKEIATMLRPMNLTMTEWFALGVIREAPGQGEGYGELAMRLDTSLPYVTKIGASLINKGWAVEWQDPNDMRHKYLTLTSWGESNFVQIEEDLRDKMRIYLYSKVTRPDLEAYLRVLAALAE